MASLKAEKPIGSQLFGQAKKDQPAAGAKTGTSAPKAPAAKKAAPKAQEPKKRPAAKGGKSAAAKQLHPMIKGIDIHGWLFERKI